MASHQIACPACGTSNRIPAEREGVAGRCGKCGSKLPPLHLKPLPLNEADFDQFIRSYPLPVLAEFWAPW